MAEDTERKKHGLVFWTVAVLIVYVLSAGPVTYFIYAEKGHGRQLLWQFPYIPLVIASNYFPPLGWYLHLWGEAGERRKNSPD